MKAVSDVNKQHKAIRAMLGSMAPKRAVAYIREQELPEDEELCLIECDVRKKSYLQVGALLCVSPEVIKRKRRAAFAKIADGMNHP